MDTGREVLKRAVEDITSGRAHWVARPPERHAAVLPVAAPTPEARREHDRLRKRQQRARRQGKPL